MGDVYARGTRRLVLALALLMLARSAPATTFVRMDAPELARGSDAAAIATVRDVHAQLDAAGRITTRVILAPERVVFGALPAGELVLEEAGGRVGALVERVFGAAEYQVGERVLTFVRRAADGTLRTTAMAMGRYALGAGPAPLARRDLGAALVLDPATGQPTALPAAERLADLLAALPGKSGRRAAPRPRTLGAPARRPVLERVPFTYLGPPSRWFEPDDGLPVRLHVDATGDLTLGPDLTRGAVLDALAVWSSVDGAALLLEDGELDAPASFAGCGGASRIVFNDPFDEIEPPVDCRGVLGIGGFCYTDETRVIGGTRYQRIRVGKLVIADGWGGCPQWTPCTLAEVLTHEVGHTIGLGHSEDEQATMSGTAHFDGRCAALAADDLTGVRTIYPAPTSEPSATPSFTPPPTPTPTAPPEATATSVHSPTPTVRPSGLRGLRGRVRYYTSGIAVPGVQMRVRGPGEREARSQAGGEYALDRLDAGDWTLEPARTGSPRGAVSTLDAAWVLQASAGLRALDAERAVVCDATGSGGITPVDAVRMLQIALGTLDRVPAGEACDSDFVFFPAAATVPNQPIGAIPPALQPGRCSIGALRYAPLGGQIDEQDFRAALLGDCTGNWSPGDPRTSEPELAPFGTELTGARLRRLRGPRWRMTVGLRAPADVHALDVELRYDAAHITPLRVRAAHLGEAALVDYDLPTPGRLVIALASAIPLPADGRAALAIDFVATAPEISQESVRPFIARADDRQVTVLVR